MDRVWVDLPNDFAAELLGVDDACRYVQIRIIAKETTEKPTRDVIAEFTITRVAAHGLSFAIESNLIP